VNPESLSELIAHLRGQFDHIVVDGASSFSELVLAAVDAADKIVLVTLQDVLAVRRARWAFDVLARLGVEPRDITVAVNQFDSQSKVTLKRIEDMFSPSPVIAIQSDSALATKSLDRGVPLQSIAAKSGLCQDIVRLAGTITDEVAYRAGQGPAVAERGLLANLFRSKA
jgi:pilus assembly protein CpaE